MSLAEGLHRAEIEANTSGSLCIEVQLVAQVLKEVLKVLKEPFSQCFVAQQEG